MKIKISTVCFIVFTWACTACTASKTHTIHIENNSNYSYTDKVISLPWQSVKQTYPSLDFNNFKITDAHSKKEIPYQLEYKGGKDIQNVLVQISLEPNSNMELVFKNEKHGNFVTKTYGRYVPERLDDFAWENDKIAYRMYGKALEEGGKGNAYGIDVWLKRTDKMILNERYKIGKYHEDLGNGLDYYHVGFTLGAGNMAPYVNDSIWYSKNYTKWKILDNGPLRTTFQLDFDEWDVNGKQMKATKTVSLDAGSQLNKIEVKYISEDKSLQQIPVVVGVIKRPESGLELMDIKHGILGYWEPQHGEDGTTGVGVIIPAKVNDMRVRKDQYLAMFEIPNNESFTYYAGAAWDKAGSITNSQQWFDYLSSQKQQLMGSDIKVIFK